MSNLICNIGVYSRWFLKALILGVGFSVLAQSASRAQQLFQGTETIQRSGVNFKLTWKARSVTTGRYGSQSTKVLYSVYEGIEFKHPAMTDGGVIMGCRITSPEEVSWSSVGDPRIGWTLSLSGICGNTHSYKALVVLPNGSTYLTEEFEAKDKPIFELQDGEIWIWSTKQEWGNMGTTGSFFVPERRVISGKYGSFRISCPPLPTDINLWNKGIPYRSFIGDFYAGLREKNSAVMLSAIRSYSNINYEWLAKQGLPDSKKGLTVLYEKTRDYEQAVRSLDGTKPASWHSQESCIRE